MKNKDIVIQDILATTNLEVSQLKEYQYFEKDNHCWLYTPVIIRFENEIYIQSWSYFINEESRVIASEMNTWGEIAFTSYEESVYYTDKTGAEVELEKIMGIIHDNLSFFKDPIFEKQSSEILKKYSLEIIIQGNDYRIRIRPFLIQEISDDLFYDSNLEKLKFNLFCPED